MADRLVSNWIETYMDYTYNSEPPDSYRKWTAISVLSACLQRKCSLQWEGTLYPNLYVVLVGNSGARKGTAMKQGRPFLEDIGGINICPEAVTREQLIRRLRRSGQEMKESESSIINHASMTVFSEELTVFLGYGNLQLMADLCDWFDCGNQWKYETKNQGSDHISNVWVSLLGATTPTLLQSTMPMDAIGGGLTSRIIFVYAPRKGKTVARPFKTEEEIRLESLLAHDLREILLLRGEFIPDRTFQDRWDQWYPEQDRNPVFSDPRLEGYLTRRGTHVLKLSMIMNVSHTSDMILTDYDFDIAVRELEIIEKNMPNVFMGIGKNDNVDVIEKIMAAVAARGEMGVDDIVGMFYYNADRETIVKIVGMMATMSMDGRRRFSWKGDNPMSKVIVYNREPERKMKDE
jgi:hypothetical protein